MANLVLRSRQVTLSKPTEKLHRSGGGKQVLDALMTILIPHLPLALRHTRITASELWAVFAYAAVHQTSPEAACRLLADAPSGNRSQEVLVAALPKRAVVQRHLNTALRAQLPQKTAERQAQLLPGWGYAPDPLSRPTGPGRQRVGAIELFTPRPAPRAGAGQPHPHVPAIQKLQSQPVRQTEGLAPTRRLGRGIAGRQRCHFGRRLRLPAVHKFDQPFHIRYGLGRA
jgi:hypothetical protein